MPYIKIQDRCRLDDNIDSLAKDIHTVGDLNYVITRLLHSEVKKNGLSYATVNALMGVLTCASNEFYRKVVVPYEEVKIAENGDVS